MTTNIACGDQVRPALTNIVSVPNVAPFTVGYVHTNVVAFTNSPVHHTALCMNSTVVTKCAGDAQVGWPHEPHSGHECGGADETTTLATKMSS